ncbi:MAG: hypothetical protein ACOH5I_14485 [Oligoflexus sp.]
MPQLIQLLMISICFAMITACSPSLQPIETNKKASQVPTSRDQPEVENQKPVEEEESKDEQTPVETPKPLAPVTLFRAFDDTYGCKGPYPAPWSCENVSLNNQEQGSFLTIARPAARYLLAAPHGWFDAGTDAITASIFPADMSGQSSIWSTMVAHSFRGNAPSNLSHNVNRPSLLDNDSCHDMPELATSKMVYERYQAHMSRLVPQAALYFEIHGQSETGLENTIEVATDRVSPAEAEAIRNIMLEELGKAEIAGIEVKIEPVEDIFFNAGLTKLCGSINHISPAPAVHTENPLVLRENEEAQLKSAKFYRAVLMRLAAEVFPPSRPTINTQNLGLTGSDVQPIKAGPRS